MICSEVVSSSLNYRKKKTHAKAYSLFFILPFQQYACMLLNFNDFFPFGLTAASEYYGDFFHKLEFACLLLSTESLFLV
jgi:hypothetical protein